MDIEAEIKDCQEISEALLQWFKSQDVPPAKSTAAMIILMGAILAEEVKKNPMSGVMKTALVFRMLEDAIKGGLKSNG